MFDKILSALAYSFGSEKLRKYSRIFNVHKMTAGVMEIAIAVSVFLYILANIIPLLILIITSKNDTAVVEYSCVKLMLGEFC